MHTSVKRKIVQWRLEQEAGKRGLRMVPAGSDLRIQISLDHLRITGIVEDKLVQRLVELASLVQLDGRNNQSFLKNLRRVQGHAAGSHAAHIMDVSVNLNEGNQLMIPEGWGHTPDS